MADNNKVTIDAAWFSELYKKAKAAKRDCKPWDCPKCQSYVKVDS